MDKIEKEIQGLSKVLKIFGDILNAEQKCALDKRIRNLKRIPEKKEYRKQIAELYGGKIIVKSTKANINPGITVIEEQTYNPQYSAQEIRAAQDNWIGKRKI